MKHYAPTVILIVLALSVFTGCSGTQTDFQSPLGQEFSLAIGQTVKITGEELVIEFVDVAEDSRCPRDVTCIQAGRAVCALRFTSGGEVTEQDIIEPGLTQSHNPAVFDKYAVGFTLNPYPVSAIITSKENYRLNLTLNLALRQ